MFKYIFDFGFTLIELLVVIMILSVVSMLAIAQYSALKARSFDAVAQQQVGEGLVALEAWKIENNSGYAGWCVNATSGSLAGTFGVPSIPSSLPTGFKQSPGVGLYMSIPGVGQSPMVAAFHCKGQNTGGSGYGASVRNMYGFNLSSGSNSNKVTRTAISGNSILPFCGLYTNHCP